MSDKIGVYVFDDKVFSREFRAYWAGCSLPKIQVFGCNYNFEFGDVYNALGDSAETLGKTCRPIRNLAEYAKAINIIRSFHDSDKAILFFDIDLSELDGGFTVTKEAFEENEMALAIEFYRTCTNAKEDSVNTEDVFAWLNDRRQGFLLLIVAAVNRSLANLEIYIASNAANIKESELLQQLTKKSSQRIVRISNYSLTSDVNHKNLVRLIEDACKNFSAIWWPSDGNVWVNTKFASIEASASDVGRELYLPDLEWFTSSCIVVPHNHEDFIPQLDCLGKEHPLARYLQNQFRLDASLVEKLLRQEVVYETLKRTIGGWALIHKGDGKRLSIQALVFAVAYAIADKQWLEELVWLSPQNEIAVDSERPLREFFGAIASLFRHLSTNQETKADNSFDVNFVKRNEGPSSAITTTLHLEVDVEFDCTSRTTSSQSLMEKILFLKYGCDGEAARRILNVIEVVSRYKLPIRLGIYPVSKAPRNSVGTAECATWTRFDFSAK